MKGIRCSSPFSSTKSMTGHPLGAAGAWSDFLCGHAGANIAPSINIRRSLRVRGPDRGNDSTRIDTILSIAWVWWNQSLAEDVPQLGGSLLSHGGGACAQGSSRGSSPSVLVRRFVAKLRRGGSDRAHGRQETRRRLEPSNRRETHRNMAQAYPFVGPSPSRHRGVDREPPHGRGRS
jgi:hypothetical protein